MINPYFCYAFSFIAAIITYQLGWSELYPELSFSLLAFLLTTIGFHLYLGLRIRQSGLIVFKSIATFPETGALWGTLFMYLLWTGEFIYAGGIPLLKILLGQPYNYRTFGIPSLHVFIVTFGSFFTICLFHLYLSSRRKVILVLYLINLCAAILIYNRGMFLFNLASSFFLLLMSVNRIPRYLLYVVPALLIVLLYLFGALGSLRVSREAKKPYTNSYFLSTGKANKVFIESPVPKEYFWTYIYVSSPLANLQHNINTNDVKDVTFGKLVEMINNELLMDFISKRINDLLRLEPEKEETIHGSFNASTMYSRSFSYWGWMGMVILALTVAAIPWLYVKLIPSDSPFFLTGFSILCTMFLFLAFDNTIRFTGLSFQLVYPFLLHFISKKFPGVDRIFVNNKVTNP
jgi:hypothetical protein